MIELAAPGGEEAECCLAALGFGQALAAETDAGAQRLFFFAQRHGERKAAATLAVGILQPLWPAHAGGSHISGPRSRQGQPPRGCYWPQGCQSLTRQAAATLLLRRPPAGRQAFRRAKPGPPRAAPRAPPRGPCG